MSRWQPPPQRDRSPPRFSERRPSGSTPYAAPAAPNSYRGPNDPNQVPIAPPRGPKADTARPSYQYGPPARGRGGFVNRLDGRERDREPRDARPAPSSYRREDDRPDWRRERDFPPAERGGLISRDSRSYVGRNRSASPGRPPRRDSKESLYPSFSRPGDGLSSYGPSPRGGAARGRGRGDWDRSRGRNSFVGDRDRDGFAPRSRSRDGWREKERERDRDNDRVDRFDRRDLDRSREREIRGRDNDSWQRDRSPGRSDSGTFGTAALTPAPAGNNALNDGYTGSERSAPRSGADFGRRQSTLLTPTNLPRDSRKESDGSDYFQSKEEPSRRDLGASRQLSPPTAAKPAELATLDYGSPPPSVPPSTSGASSYPPTEKAVVQQPSAPAPAPPAPAAQSQPTPKSEASVTSRTPFLPPTGPKANRGSSNLYPTAAPPRAPASDPWPKSDPLSRSLRPGPAPSPSNSGTEQVAKRPETASETRSSPSAPSDRRLPPTIPLGPRLDSRSIPGDLNSSPAPPIAPKGASRVLSGEYRGNIPTGPREWAAPGGYKPTGPPSRPSIMSGMNNKQHYNDGRDRQTFAPGSQRPSFSYGSQNSRPRMFQPSIMNRTTDFDADTGRSADSILGSTAMAKEHSRRMQEKLEGMDPDVSMNPSSEDEDGLDEEDFQDSEDKFLKEMRVLELKKPKPPLRDPAIVALLLRIQMLGIIASGSIPATFEAKAESIATNNASGLTSTGLLSPERQPDELLEDGPPSVEIAPPLGRPLKEPPVNPIPTPPIEDLPYLKTANVPRFETFDDSEDEVEFEATSMLVRQVFEREAWEWSDELLDLKTKYFEHFLVWRDGIASMESERDLKASTPTPASPALSIAPALTPQLTHERTRGGKNATDLDLQNAIRISEQSAREEEERRAREKSKPNYETEAVVPSMLQPAEILIMRFKDTNQLIGSDVVLDKFALIPPRDDFSDEEQRIFVAAYCQYPKKWGKIAESLPGRTYQQCITHYYLTKDEANYKESFRRAQPRKRGRRVAATQPRSNALLTDNMFATDSENPPMTDTGRPKRAAAPTFGDTGMDADAGAMPQASKRLAAALKDSNGEQAAGKTTRGRKAGTGTKVRRTKAQILEDQQRAQMQQNGVDISPQKNDSRVDKSKVLKIVQRGTAPKNDALQNIEFQRPQDMDVPIMALMPAAEYSVPNASTGPMQSTGPQITSYWSVPEQQKFPSLIAYFGRDYTAIADFMKTKSVIMIKNFYQRQLSDGKRELEEAAIIAEEKRNRGEPMGSPPTPVAPPKRRYEATPSMASAPRALASALEPVVPKSEPLPLTGNSSLIDEFVPNATQGSVRGEIIAKPRSTFRDITNQSPSTLVPQQQTVDDLASERSLQQARQGPPRGFFLPDRHSNERRPAHMHGHNQETSSQQLHTSRTVDLTQPEINQQRHSLLPQQSVVSTAHEQHQQSQSQAHVTSQLPFHQTETSTYPHRHSLLGHSRQSSTSGVSAIPGGQEINMDSSFRRQEPHRGLFFGLPTASSPVSAHSQQASAPRVDLTRPSSTPAAPSTEPPKPAPAKRSNIMSILNDDPPEPQPAKRNSLDGNRPVPTTHTADVSMESQRRIFQQAREQVPEHQMNDLIRQRNLYDGPPSHTPSGGHHTPSQPPSTGYGSPALPHANQNQWLHRMDPRQQSAGNEPGSGSLHQSPGPTQPTSQYSVAPPTNTQSSALPTIQRVHKMEMPNRLDQGRSIDLSRHRSALGQINHPGHVASPPPQQQMQLPAHSASSQPTQQYRAASSSSQHGRVNSGGYAHPHTQQTVQQHQLSQQQQQQQAQPHSHSHSASSTPVSSLHQHRSHGSMGVGFSQSPRMSLRQQPSQQQQQNTPQLQSQYQQIAEAERRRQDYEMQQQMIREQENRRRDMLFQQQQDQDRQQRDQQQRNSYPGLSAPPRTFTPPGIQQQQQQQGMSHGHGSGGLGKGLNAGAGLDSRDLMGRESQGQAPGQPGTGTAHYRQPSQGGADDRR